MKTLLLPVLLLLLGTAGGVGAGLALTPAEPPPDPCAQAPAEGAPGEGPAEAAPAEAEGEPAPPEGFDYVRLNNQFVVPVVEGGAVEALVLLSLSVEVRQGQEEAVLLIEPKLRDVFLQALFDHANTGGFEGMFTAAEPMRNLRRMLREAAREEVGGMITDVLIVDLVRQEA